MRFACIDERQPLPQREPPKLSRRKPEIADAKAKPRRPRRFRGARGFAFHCAPNPAAANAAAIAAPALGKSTWRASSASFAISCPPPRNSAARIDRKISDGRRAQSLSQLQERAEPKSGFDLGQSTKSEPQAKHFAFNPEIDITAHLICHFRRP